MSPDRASSPRSLPRRRCEHPTTEWTRNQLRATLPEPPGSIRRDLLDHVIVLGQVHARSLVRRYAEYYNSTRTHLSLAKDSPDGRADTALPCGRVRRHDRPKRFITSDLRPPETFRFA